MIRSVTLLLLTLCAMALAQVKVKDAPQLLAGDERTPLSSPLWSPDGGLIALTSPDYTGIWLMQPDGTGLRPIGSERGAGFGMQWSPDSRALVARVSRLESGRMKHALRLYDIERQADTLLCAYRTGMTGLPGWSPDARQVLVFRNDVLSRFDSGLSIATLQRPSPRTFCLLDIDQPRLIPPGEPRARAVPALAGKRILNLVHSADGSRVAFQILGGPLCVMKNDGTELSELGAGEWPSFSPDGRYLAYMITEDDGHTITGADILAIAVDGSDKINLTNSRGRSEMHPSWSPRGDAILYDVLETGEIWKLPVMIPQP
ncbi:MAG TPA: hypothetical protein PKI62_07120 [bacterium]|nr:hypothetical protein [bacterium]HPR87235.1 hypothetical protein [bacterium]